MVGTVNAERTSRALEFGMYRDGDNNLDEVQAETIAQAVATSKSDREIEFTVEDTTSRRGFEPEHVLRTESYTIADGKPSHAIDITAPHDMSARSDLTKFVAHVLDNAENAHAKQAWIDLIDHGGGDGGGLQSDHGDAGVMREDDIAGAIADGVDRVLVRALACRREIPGGVARDDARAGRAIERRPRHRGPRRRSGSDGRQRRHDDDEPNVRLAV